MSNPNWKPVLALGLAAFAVLATAEASVEISHDPVDCIVVNTFPEFEAGFTPSPIGTSRLFFKAKGTADWYFVDFTGNLAVIPKPSPTLEGVDYYVYGAADAATEQRTAIYRPIVSTRTYCENESWAMSKDHTEDVALVIGLLRFGQSAIPEGFLADAISAVLLPDGAMVSLAEALRPGSTGSAGSQAAQTGAKVAAKAGMSAGKVVGLSLGGLAVAGGAVALSDSGGGDGGGPTTNCTGTPQMRVFDSGNIADDVFEVTVDGTFLGSTPIGGVSNFQICGIRRGGHTLRVRCTRDTNPDCTLGVDLFQGLRFSDGSTMLRDGFPLDSTRSYSFTAP